MRRTVDDARTAHAWRVIDSARTSSSPNSNPERLEEFSFAAGASSDWKTLTVEIGATERDRVGSGKDGWARRTGLAADLVGRVNRVCPLGDSGHCRASEAGEGGELTEAKHGV